MASGIQLDPNQQSWNSSLNDIGGAVEPSKDTVIDLFLTAAGATDSQYGQIMAHIRDGTAAGAGSQGLLRSGVGTASEDSTGNLNLTVTGQWSTASASLAFTLKHALAKVVL